MRYWTVEEARAELPRLRVLIDALRRGAHQTSVAQLNGHGRLAGAVPPDRGDADPGEPEPGGDEPGPGDEDIDVRSALAELREKDIVLRDAESGLLDFPAVTPSGVVYLLCWKRDEEDLGWWHFAEEGFAGRKPLPLPPDL